jgi:hypothetical protein
MAVKPARWDSIKKIVQFIEQVLDQLYWMIAVLTDKDVAKASKFMIL